MPQNTVRFSGLNDNIDRKFLHELCESYGDISEYKVYFDPKTNRHTGTGKVIFDEKTNTSKVVDALNGRQVMGKVIKVWIDLKCKYSLSCSSISFLFFFFFCRLMFLVVGKKVSNILNFLIVSITVYIAVLLHP